MDLSAVVMVLCLGISITWYVFSRYRRRGKLPPGPYPLPIIGNIFELLGDKPHQALAKLSKKYGPLMSLHLGSLYTVVVSSPEMAKEILQKHDQVFCSRTVISAVEVRDHHKFSMGLLPPGSKWRELRKLSKEQIFANVSLEASEGLRVEKLEKLCEYIRKCSDSSVAVDIGEAVFTTILNLMSATIFSSEFASYDAASSSSAIPEFKKIFDAWVVVLGVPNVADFFPILKPLDPQGIKRKSEFYFSKLMDFIEGVINERLVHFPNNEKNDMLETVLVNYQLGLGTEDELSINDISHLFADLLVGGTHTSASTIEWAMTELLLNPEMLSKAKQELRSIIGDDKKIVGESDIQRLPYLQAVIKEVFRYHPPGPFLLPRKSESDVEVAGYLVPKDTYIQVNVWAIGRDPRIWSNPDCFDPERFLDNNYNLLDFKGQSYELIPFGSGRRMCPGLPLADRMLHITVATLIHNFDWKLVGDVADHDVPDIFGYALRKGVPIKAIPINLMM